MERKIRLIPADLGYDILEPGYKEGTFLTAARAYGIKKKRLYLLCFEDYDRNFMRVGSRQKDIESTVFDHERRLSKALKILHRKASRFARALLERRGYGRIEDLSTSGI